MAVELPASDEEKAARNVIELAGAALARRRSDIPGTFVAQLYGRCVPEDVVRYGADDIVALA
jgi:glutamate dehydrogenase